MYPVALPQTQIRSSNSDGEITMEKRIWWGGLFQAIIAFSPILINSDKINIVEEW